MVATSTEELLKERLKTHGDFTDHATAAQFLKDWYRSWPNWDKLTPMQKETMDMIAHKQARILTGNPDLADHWDDIAGYAILVSQRIHRPVSDMQRVTINTYPTYVPYDYSAVFPNPDIMLQPGQMYGDGSLTQPYVGGIVPRRDPPDDEANHAKVEF